ncbi:flagellar hook protein, partial [Escherichia coli]|uniref:flagellar cap protein FliD N-terminal domain-containing protein n=1 Tax=Escherichia coli TaxID=562 RepID=UPI0029278271
MFKPSTIAQEIASADVATQATHLQDKQSELDAERCGLDSLSSALSDFQSAVDALNSDTDGPVTFAATSKKDSATVSANSQAQAGSYAFFVEQLAQGEHTTLSMGDDAFSATGTWELTLLACPLALALASSSPPGAR